MERAAATAFFVTGEDLTCQAGLAVQQDLALGALIGVTHAERNGHHYVDGFGDTPRRRAAGVPRRASRSLRARAGNGIRLAIHDGDLLTGSLTSPGLCAGASIRTVVGAVAAASTARNRILQEQAIMTTQRLGIIMNGVTGRMGLNQHLIRSIVAIRDAGRRAARRTATA